MMVNFVVTADGSVTVSRQELRQGRPRRESRLPEIQEKIADPNSPAAEIMRLIHQELALVIGEMRHYEHDKSAAPKLRNCAVQVTALCALQKLVERADARSKKDLLNFDGPKFQYVFGELVDLFKKAAEQALGRGSEPSVQSIMRHFRDLVAMHEQDLRRGTEKIGAANVQH